MQSFPVCAHAWRSSAGAAAYSRQDSKATNADAARGARDLRSGLLDRRRPGEGAGSSLSRILSTIAKAYLIGTAADDFSGVRAGQVPHVIAGDIDTAVQMGRRRSDPSVQSRSSSFAGLRVVDQFTDFERARGVPPCRRGT